MQRITITFLLLLSATTMAGFEELKKIESPPITLSESDTILLEAQLKKKEKKEIDVIIVQMVCKKDKRKYKCDPIKLSTPEK